MKEIVTPGQTIDSYSVNCFPGGKGLNQTLALARAGAMVFHAGMIGEDGISLKQLLENDNVDCRFLRTVTTNTGTAFIQVADDGQNSIVLNGGANRKNTIDFCDEVLENFNKNDIILLQNEINNINYLIEKAYEKHMFIVLNPSPMNKCIMDCDLGKVSLFIMNEDEGQQITGKDTPEDILSSMRVNYPKAEVVLTLGSKGAIYQKGEFTIVQKAFHVEPVDTTAAGDTFTGYLIATMTMNMKMSKCLQLASKAAAIAVTRKGATSSIPYMREALTANL